jgi:hypothetical protein
MQIINEICKNINHMATVLLVTQPSGLRNIVSLKSKAFHLNQNLKLQSEFPHLCVKLDYMEEADAIALIQSEPMAAPFGTTKVNVVEIESKLNEKDAEIAALKAALAEKAESTKEKKK